MGQSCFFGSPNRRLLTRLTRYSHKMGSVGDVAFGDVNGGRNGEELGRDRVVLCKRYSWKVKGGWKSMAN